MPTRVPTVEISPQSKAESSPFPGRGPLQHFTFNDESKIDVNISSSPQYLPEAAKSAYAKLIKAINKSGVTSLIDNVDQLFSSPIENAVAIGELQSLKEGHNFKMITKPIDSLITALEGIDDIPTLPITPLSTR
ncbi:MAG: hypothetical protein GKR77_02735 [Legionellales bacterium]|nr:hypothetical protein [Legionellales bacterium]